MGMGQALDPDTAKRSDAAAAAARTCCAGGMLSYPARSLAYMVGTPISTVMPPSCEQIWRGKQEAFPLSAPQNDCSQAHEQEQLVHA